MHTLGVILACCAVEVAEELVGIEGCNRCYQSAQRVETSVECLISREFVGCHFAAPETRLVQTDVPVGKVVDDE